MYRKLNSWFITESKYILIKSRFKLMVHRWNVLNPNTSGILVRPRSDHQMYFCVMNENYDRPTTKQKYIEIEVLNEETVESLE